MIAIASCVRPLAVPGPAPGPCDAKAASPQHRPVTVDATTATRKIRPLAANPVMATSHDEHTAEDTAIVYAGGWPGSGKPGRELCRNEIVRFASCLWRSRSDPIHVICFKLDLRRGEATRFKRAARCGREMPWTQGERR